MSDGTVSGTFGEAFGKLGSALNQWSTWGVLVLAGIGFMTFNILRAIIARKTNTSDRSAKANLLTLGLFAGIAAVVALIGDFTSGRLP